MISKLRNAGVNAVLLGALAAASLVALPAAAQPPRLPLETVDRIRALCEASSMDLAGQREQRRCRAEWTERLERLSLEKGRPVRLTLR